MFLWEEVQKLARAHHIQDPLENNETFERFLRFWWCQKYNRPMKDPLLNEYTMEELTYEWLRYIYLQPENDPKKQLETKLDVQDEDEWIKARMAQLQASQTSTPVVAPVVTPEAEAPEIPEVPDISTKF